MFTALSPLFEVCIFLGVVRTFFSLSLSVEFMIMDLGISSLAIASAIVLCSCLCFIATHLFSGTHLPPGPVGLPIVGNLLQLGSHARSHQTLAQLASKYGPVMTLRLGCIRTVVISSTNAARETLRVHDLALAGRTLYEAMKLCITENVHGTEISAREGSIITAQYGPSWRLLRRLSAVEFFSNKRLDAMKSTRRECLSNTVRFIREESEDGKKAVDVGKFVYLTNFNVIGSLIFSRNLVDLKCEERNEFFHLANKIIALVGQPNVADFIPILKWFDPQGIKRKSQCYMEKVFEIITALTEERIQARMNRGEDEIEDQNDYLDVLLNFRGQRADEPSKFPSVVINAIVLEMFIAGADTTTRAVEWALSELLRNPAIMAKVLSELDNVAGCGENGNILEEEDLEKLPYLRAVVKESLRLHPSAPLMVPHRAMESCTLMGYHIPKDTQVLVNAWALGRDPLLWEDPHCFKPERFLDSAVDYKGQHFQYIPFGSGRRMCAGMPLAHRMVPLILGTFLLSFNWVLPDGLTPETMDMRERLGISLGKAVPLKAIPLPRIMQKAVN